MGGASRARPAAGFQGFVARRAGAAGAFSAVLLYVGVAAANAQQTTPPSTGELGRIEFAHTSSAKKFVEIDLSPAMFADLFGIGDAALSGVADALQNSPQAKEGSQAIQFAAQKAASANPASCNVKTTAVANASPVAPASKSVSGGEGM